MPSNRRAIPRAAPVGTTGIKGGSLTSVSKRAPDTRRPLLCRRLVLTFREGWLHRSMGHPSASTQPSTSTTRPVSAAAVHGAHVGTKSHGGPSR